MRQLDLPNVSTIQFRRLGYCPNRVCVGFQYILLIRGYSSFGRFQLKAIVKDDEGRTSECKVTFVLFSLKDKKVPVKSKVWCYQSGKEFDESGNATVYFGSSEDEVCLFYDVYSNDQWIERKRLEFSDSLLTFPFKYEEEYGNGLCVSFFFAKRGKMYAKCIRISKPRPDKKLLLTWKTFRDKLNPGSREIWVMNIMQNRNLY